MPVRILICEDERMMRQGLRSMLEGTEGLTVVGEAGNGREAMERAGELQPDLILMDMCMPEVNGIDATRSIFEAGSQAKIIMLTVSTSSRSLAEALSAGAAGYVLKHGPFEELVRAMEAVREGKLFISPSIATEFLGRYVRGGGAAGSVFEALTRREREVLQMLAEGHAAKSIADRLEVSTKTVEAHRRQIMEKLGVDSVALLTKYAVREGLTPLEV